MSHTTPTGAEQAQLEYRCLTCGAQAGEWCRTKNGYACTCLHSNRFYAWRNLLDSRPASLLRGPVNGVSAGDDQFPSRGAPATTTKGRSDEQQLPQEADHD